jgi:hypothetical protein
VNRGAGRWQHACGYTQRGDGCKQHCSPSCTQIGNRRCPHAPMQKAAISSSGAHKAPSGAPWRAAAACTMAAAAWCLALEVAAIAVQTYAVSRDVRMSKE